MVTLGAEVLTPRLAPEPPPTRLHMPLCRYPPAWANHSCLIKSYRQAAPFILLSAASMLTLVESVCNLHRNLLCVQGSESKATLKA